MLILFADRPADPLDRLQLGVGASRIAFDRIAAIDAIDREVDTHIEPFRTAILLLTTMPGSTT
jgi:hypothetical protein